MYFVRAYKSLLKNKELIMNLQIARGKSLLSSGLAISIAKALLRRAKVGLRTTCGQQGITIFIDASLPSLGLNFSGSIPLELGIRAE